MTFKPTDLCGNQCASFRLLNDRKKKLQKNLWNSNRQIKCIKPHYYHDQFIPKEPEMEATPPELYSDFQPSHYSSFTEISGVQQQFCSYEHERDVDNAILPESHSDCRNLSFTEILCKQDNEGEMYTEENDFSYRNSNNDLNNNSCIPQISNRNREVSQKIKQSTFEENKYTPQYDFENISHIQKHNSCSPGKCTESHNINQRLSRSPVRVVPDNVVGCTINQNSDSFSPGNYNSFPCGSRNHSRNSCESNPSELVSHSSSNGPNNYACSHESFNYSDPLSSFNYVRNSGSHCYPSSKLSQYSNSSDSRNRDHYSRSRGNIGCNISVRNQNSLHGQQNYTTLQGKINTKLPVCQSYKVQQASTCSCNKPLKNQSTSSKLSAPPEMNTNCYSSCRSNKISQIATLKKKENKVTCKTSSRSSQTEESCRKIKSLSKEKAEFCYEKENMNTTKQDSINMLSCVVSTVMLLATGCSCIPDTYANWTIKYLKCIKNMQGQYPANVKKILKMIRNERNLKEIDTEDNSKYPNLKTS